MFYKIKCGHTITIEKLHRISGIKASTLRYWEAIGLLKSLSRSSNKTKRRFVGGDVLLLQQILLLKRAGFSLQEIKQKVSIERRGHINLLLEQNRSLKLELQSVQRIINIVTRTICALRGKGRGLLTDYRLLSCFNKGPTRRSYFPRNPKLCTIY